MSRPKTTTLAQERRIWELRDQLKSIRGIARELEVGVKVVRRVLEQMPPLPMPPRTLRRWIALLWDETHNQSGVARELGISRGRVQRYLKSTQGRWLVQIFRAYRKLSVVPEDVREEVIGRMFRRMKGDTC